MKRTLSLDLDCLIDGPSELSLQLCVSHRDGLELDDALVVENNGAALETSENLGVAGTRLVTAWAEAGELSVRYSASVDDLPLSSQGDSVSGGIPSAADPELSPYERGLYRRASRYCESDRFEPTAIDIANSADIALGETGQHHVLAVAIANWVHQHFSYVPGSSNSADSAVDVWFGRSGVCRDYAHCTIALLRSVGIPARYVSVFAPGCSPMDLHAVVEAYVNGSWRVLDPSRLAPRQSLVRVATGRDAADTAFLENHSSFLTVRAMSVTAIVEGQLPRDDYLHLDHVLL